MLLEKEKKEYLHTGTTKHSITQESQARKSLLTIE